MKFQNWNYNNKFKIEDCLGAKMKKIIGFLILILSIGLLSGCVQKTDDNLNEEASSDNFWGDVEYVANFELKDINENLVNNSIFEEKEYTLVNIWGTFCKPCIDEIPILQEIYEESENINVVGIVADGDVSEIKAFEMLNKLGADYVNLIPNDAFLNSFLNKVQVAPVSIIVDKQGKILETIVGARTKVEYEEILKSYKTAGDKDEEQN